MICKARRISAFGMLTLLACCCSLQRPPKPKADAHLHYVL